MRRKFWDPPPGAGSAAQGRTVVRPAFDAVASSAGVWCAPEALTQVPTRWNPTGYP